MVAVRFLQIEVYWFKIHGKFSLQFISFRHSSKFLTKIYNLKPEKLHSFAPNRLISLLISKLETKTNSSLVHDRYHHSCSMVILKQWLNSFLCLCVDEKVSFFKHSLNKPSGYQCSNDEFSCDNGQCVASSLRCDGDMACLDNSDEHNCTCLSVEFKCGSGACIHVTKLCDGVKDCPEGSDETNCGNVTDDSCINFKCVLD